MLRVVDLHNSDVVLQWVAESFLCERVRDLSCPDFVLSTMDCASRVSNCVIVFVCCLVPSIVS